MPALPSLRPLLLVACQKSVVTPFPAGLEPLATCSAGFPEPADESAKATAGEGEDYIYAHVCGYVEAKLEAVWAAIQDVDVITDRRRIEDYQLTEQGFDPDYDVSFRVFYHVEDFITVEYEVEWRQGVWEVQDEAPKSVVDRYQKVEGSSFIERMEGSIVLDEEEPGLVRFELINQHKSLGYTTDELLLKSTDLYDSVVAFAHGEPLPTYE